MLATKRPFVFIADDDDLDTSLSLRAIRRALPDAEIQSANDGEQALALLTSIAGSDRWPDFVLLDFKMPRKGCLEILSELAHPDVLASVPFILFSSSVCPSDVANCRVKGIREYIEKPTDPETYDRIVQDLCARYAKPAKTE